LYPVKAIDEMRRQARDSGTDMQTQ